MPIGMSYCWAIVLPDSSTHIYMYVSMYEMMNHEDDELLSSEYDCQPSLVLMSHRVGRGQTLTLLSQAWLCKSVNLMRGAGVSPHSSPGLALLIWPSQCKPKKFKTEYSSMTQNLDLPEIPSVMKLLAKADAHPVWDKLAPSLVLAAAIGIATYKDTQHGLVQSEDERLAFAIDEAARAFLSLAETHGINVDKT